MGSGGESVAARLHRYVERDFMRLAMERQLVERSTG
jgi:hypothetical protein